MAELTNITPTDDTIFIGSDFTIKVTLTDSAGTAVTGERANLTLLIEKPDGTQETALTSTDLTDAGAGLYTYTYRTANVGVHYFTWTYDNATNKRVKEGRFLVSRVRTG